MQGKIIYGPFNSDTQEISLSNKTFEDLAFLKEFIKVFKSTSQMAKTDLEFQKKYNEMLHNPKILESLSTINSIVNNIYNKTRTSEMLDIIDKALNCFSVDRFVSAKDENDFELKAHKLMKTDALLAGVYFKNIEAPPKFSMTMPVGNNPVTIEIRNGLWFQYSYDNVQLQTFHIRRFAHFQNFIEAAVEKFHKEKYKS